MVLVIKYKKSIIDHAIYIKVFYYGTVSHIEVSTDDVLNTTNNETGFPELKIYFEEHFEKKFQEGSVLRYLSFLVCQSPLAFSVDQNDHITEIVNEWIPAGFFRKVDTNSSTYSTYEKELLSALLFA